MASSHDIVSDPFTENLIHIKANQLCRRRDFSRSDRDDLEQAMRVYLLEKAHLFDPARGNLEAFVINALGTWSALHLRHRKRLKRHKAVKARSLERTPVECDGEITTLGEVLLEEDGQRLTQTAPLSPFEEVDLQEGMAHVLAHLSPEDRTLLTSVAENGISATARKLGVSWKQVKDTMLRLRPVLKKRAEMEKNQ